MSQKTPENSLKSDQIYSVARKSLWNYRHRDIEQRVKPSL